MALPKPDSLKQPSRRDDTRWYPVEQGTNRTELTALAKRLELLYPGRYETRVAETPDVSGWNLSVRHKG
jgi:hypothetical protein